MRPIVNHRYPASPRTLFVGLRPNHELILQLTRREVLIGLGRFAGSD
jgi:hypothetical protein